LPVDGWHGNWASFDRLRYRRRTRGWRLKWGWAVAFDRAQVPLGALIRGNPFRGKFYILRRDCLFSSCYYVA